MRLLTWNLQGREGLDLGRVAAYVTACSPDVVALQEVQHRQARRLASVLEWHQVWAWKHAPLVAPAEGAALLTPHPLGDVSRTVLQRALFTSWRRRIALGATVEIDGRSVTVVDAHLSPHELGTRRLDEVERLVRFATQRYGHPGREVVIAGDFNEEPPSGVFERLASAGWVDAWESTPARRRLGAGPTNWTAGPRSGRPATQRLDAVFVPQRSECRAAMVPTERSEELSALSDHLPLLVEFS